MISQEPIKGEAKITFLVNREYTSITVEDSKSGMRILELILTPQQLSEALSRLSNTRCQAEIYVDSAHKWGKKLETKKYEFSIGNPGITEDREKLAISILDKTDLGEWEYDSYLRSRDSFFQKDGEQWARVMLRRWVNE